MVLIVEPASTCLVVVMGVVSPLPQMYQSHSSATVRRVGKEPSVISVSYKTKLWKLTGSLNSRLSCHNFTAACPDHCSNQGKCVVTSDGGRQCNCNLGWTGETCADCTANVGCILNNTITEQGCQKLDPDNSTLTIDEPNTCQCSDDWQGPFCGIPKCLNSAGNETLECVNGVCTEGGVVSHVWPYSR